MVGPPNECIEGADGSCLERIARIAVLIGDRARRIHLHAFGIVLVVLSQEVAAVCGGRDVIHPLDDGHLFLDARAAFLCRRQLLVEVHVFVCIGARGGGIKRASEERAVQSDELGNGRRAVVRPGVLHGCMRSP